LGKGDTLRGLKENIIIGRLIAGGTGLASHRAKKEKEAWEVEERSVAAAREGQYGFPAASDGGQDRSRNPSRRRRVIT
jgi:DNA-directed RNA polymerase subunit beta'